MSIIINGQLQNQDFRPNQNDDGEFVRQDSQFRNWVTADGQADSSVDKSAAAEFKAEPDRYHLYVSLACPWAHRTLIFRKLKKLEDIISVSVVHPDLGWQGWRFEADERFGEINDQINHFDFMYQVYTKADPDYTGVVTVPVLWDRQRETIVNNESSEIIRMFNSAFNDLTGDMADYYPQALRTEIDNINELVYANVNNGVYRCGFASSQQAYEKAFDNLFAALDKLELRLEQQRYLAGNILTEADWRLFTTLYRFDPVYVGHFKCNKKRIADYPNLSNYLRELYQLSGIQETCSLQHIKYHYYYSHTCINPTRIVPKGPELDLMQPHDRNRFE